MTFSILRGTSTVIQAHGFVTFLGIDYDKKKASQISNDRIIVTKFMMKKDIFVAEDLLLHGIGDEAIFVTQIMKHNENSTFSDINGISKKPTCVVVCVGIPFIFFFEARHSLLFNPPRLAPLLPSLSAWCTTYLKIYCRIAHTNKFH